MKTIKFFCVNLPEWTFLLAIAVIQVFSFRYFAVSSDFAFEFGRDWYCNIALLLSVFPLLANITFIRLRRLQDRKVYLHVLTLVTQTLSVAMIISSFFYNISDTMLIIFWLIQLTAGAIYIDVVRKEQHRYLTSSSVKWYTWILTVLVVLSPAWLMISIRFIAMYLYLYNIVDEVPKVFLIFLNPKYSLGIAIVVLHFLYLRYLTGIVHACCADES